MMKKVLEGKDIDVIALGCTHFPLVRKEFESAFGPHVSVIDSGAAVARHVRRICENNDLLSSGNDEEDEFFTTGDARKISRVFSSLLNRSIVVRSMVVT